MGSKRIVVVAIALAAIYTLLKIAGYVQGERIGSSWERVSEKLGNTLVARVQTSFASYQAGVYRSTGLVTQSAEIQQEMAKGDSADPKAIFTTLIGSTPTDLTVEIYNSRKQLFAWRGASGPPTDTSAFGAVPSSFVVEQPLYSYLVVVIPHPIDSTRKWYSVGKRLFDANYPISNRFINKTLFSSTFTSRLAEDILFNFESDSTAPPVEGELSAPLTSVDGKRLGFAYIPLPTPETHLEASTRGIRKGEVLCLFAGIVLVVYVSFRIAGGMSGWGGLLLLSFVIWGARYAVLLLEGEDVFFGGGLFEPTMFASQFGFGLARSLGDLLLSCLTLLCNLLIIVPRWRTRTLGILPPRLFAIRKIAALAGVALSALFLCGVSRAFEATIQSAVFDSAILFNDPTFILPPTDLAIMLASLGCVALAVILAGAMLLQSAKDALAGAFTSFGEASCLLSVFVVCALVSYLFGVVHPNPLLSQVQRVLILAGILFITLIHRLRGDRVFGWGGMTVNFIGAMVLLIPLFDLKVHELDRSHVELLTAEISGPTDHWQNIVVNQALDQLANGDAAAVLAAHKADDIEKLAFTQWAKSILSREGNNCSIRILNENGIVVSEFALGITPHMYREQLFEIAPTRRYVDIEAVSPKGDIQWHRGYSPIFSPDGMLQGGVWIELSSGRGTFLRGDTPELLKNYSKENFENHFRTLEIAQYDHDTLSGSTNENMPVGSRLPEAFTSTRTAGWIDQSIDSKRYETYFYPYENGGAAWLALSLEELDIRWHLYTYLRYILFYLVAGTLISALFFLISFIRGRLGVLTFRAKLMTAFIVVSSLPIIIVAYYNRAYAVEQADERITKKLEETTSLIAAQLERQNRVTIPSELAKLSDSQCLTIADQLDADFNVYYGVTLQATSRPEIFDAELLDRRLSANAVAGLILGKLNYLSQNESIGNLPYVVGYRPLRTESGMVVGVVSMPTLFRQSEIDEELTRRNVFLFGAYAIALVITVLSSTLFAKQIAAPIMRLRVMASRVAGGDYSARIDSRRTDELGELERAFDSMTTNIRVSQEERLKAQRELAWKEMAQQVAHEIKNPLTPMKLSVQHLQQAHRDGAANFGDIFRQVTRTVLEQIETLSRITSEFSQFARMPRRTIARCSVHALLSDAISLYNQHRNVRWKSNLGAPVDAVSADPEELRRAFVNILRNSLQAIGHDGTIEIETSAGPEGEASLAAGPNSIVITFVDDGPGIAPEIESRLFTPNFSTKTDGMGLGLTIVKKTIEDAGGSITIANVPGKGAGVTIQLPLADSSREA